MKPSKILLTVVVLLLALSPVFSQLRINGFLQSSGYGWENLNQDKQWDYYQALRLRIMPQNYQNLYLNTYMREAYRGDPQEWQEKVYNLYANWNLSQNYRLRVGRQFLYDGVLNGTVDGGLFSAWLPKGVGIKVLAGTEAPFDRKFKIKNWDDGNVLGGYLSYILSPANRMEVSYVQKTRNDDQYWQQLGGALKGYICNGLNYYARLDYNLLSSSYQLMRYRLTYYGSKWSLGAEYNSQKPRIYEDSFFNIFEVYAYNQVRTEGTYRLGGFDLGLQYLYTFYKEKEHDNRFIASVAQRWGSIGVIYQDGYGGKNVGYFGQIAYEFLPGLTARLFNSYYQYDRAVTQIDEDALAFSGGLRYRLKNMFVFEGEIQETNNTYYKNDWRGLLRATYLFDF